MADGDIATLAEAQSLAGVTTRYVSPYGKLPGLAVRIAEWRARLSNTARHVPSNGEAPANAFWGGLIADLGAVMQILDLREFAEHLRVNGTAEQRAFADEILRNEETLEAVDQAIGSAGLTNFDPPAAVETLARERDAAVQADRSMREFLAEQGVLADGDVSTPLAPLLRMLLS